MIIRSFVSDSAASALKEVRTQMGGDAVVLKTREVRTGNGAVQFEVTACLDNPTAAQASVALAETPRRPEAVTMPESSHTHTTPSRLAPEVLQRVEAPMSSDVSNRLDVIEALLTSYQRQNNLMLSGLSPRLIPAADCVQTLAAADIPHTWLAAFLGNLLDHYAPESITEELIRTNLVSRLGAMIGPQIKLTSGDRVLVTGLAGCGKTSLVGRLASWLVTQQKMAVRLISLDSSKVGALDEIQNYGDLLGIDVTDPSVLLQTPGLGATPSQGKVVTLIDSGALPARPEARAEYMDRLDEVYTTHRLLVCSMLTRSSDVTRLATALADLRPTHLVMTMTDLTPYWGVMIAAADALGIKVIMMTDSPSCAGNMEAPDARKVASVLLSGEVPCDK
jgi:flagellar biosynthesis protein FlhF